MGVGWSADVLCRQQTVAGITGGLQPSDYMGTVDNAQGLRAFLIAAFVWVGEQQK